jgi:hypothetical protein
MPVLVNTDSGLAEDLPQEAADQAVSAGTHEVPIVSPDGTQGTAPPADAAQLLQQGYRQPSPQELQNMLKTSQYSTPGETAKAGLEAAGRGFAGPAFTAAERAVGVNPEDILGRQEAHPVLAPAVEAGTFAGSALLGTGEAKALSLLGDAIKGGKGAGVLAKALGLGSEFAAYSAGDQASQWLMNDPNVTTGSAMSSIGLNALIGAGVGGAFGAISPLWKATVGPQVSQFLEDLQSRLKYRSQNPDLVGAISGQLADFYDSVNGLNKNVWGSNGLKMKLAQEMLPEVNEKILGQARDIGGRLQNAVDMMKASPDFTDQQVAKIQNQLDRLNVATSIIKDPISLETIKKPGSLDVFQALNDAKQSLQEYGQYGVLTPPSERPFTNQVRDLAATIRKSLEDPQVWGDAGTLQKDINQGFQKWLKISDGAGSFKSRFTSLVNGDPVIDRGKIATFLNQLPKDSGAIKKEVLGQTIDAGTSYKDVVNQAFAKLGIESPIEATPLDHVDNALNKVSLGQKAADYLYNKGAANILGEGLGTAIGGGVGAFVGHPAIGAFIGDRALTPFISSVLPTFIKPIMERGANAEGFKAGSNLLMAALRGDTALNQGVKALFNAGSSALTEQKEMGSKDKDKLKARLDELANDPSSLMQTGGQSGFYHPDHATKLSENASRSVQYLNSIKPKDTQQSPLDKTIPPSDSVQRAYDRNLDLAQNPMLSFKHLKDGTLSLNDVNTIKNTNPGWYQLASQKIVKEMTNAAANGKPIPMDQRISLSKFLGQPLDSNLNPQVMINMQNAHNAPSLSQQGLPKQGRKTEPLGPLKNIKLASRVATRTQDLQEDED